jgi:type I restriction enzyme S subunit
MKFSEMELGDAIRIKHGFAFKGEFFTNAGGHILLTPGNCYERGGLRLKGDKEKFYVGDIPDEYILNSGDLIVVMTDLVNSAPILGGAFFIPEDDRFLHNQRLGLVQVLDDRKIDKNFLYYALNSESYRAQVRGSATGATVRHTAPERIYRCRIKVPPLLSQRAIGETLKNYDDLIENNRRRMELLEKSASLLFKEWFVRLRYPGHERAKISDGVPEGWERRTLQYLCVDGNGIQTGPFGSQLHESDYTPDGVPVVMPRDLIDARINTDRIARIPEGLAYSLGRHRMRIGDVVYGRRGDIGRRAFIGSREDGWFCGTGCLRLRPDQARVFPQYFFAALGHPIVAGTIAGRAKGATMPNLNASVMRDVEMVIPPTPLQQEYVEQAETTWRLVEVLVKSVESATKARDVLLPRLMDGRISV